MRQLELGAAARVQQVRRTPSHPQSAAAVQVRRQAQPSSGTRPSEGVHAISKHVFTRALTLRNALPSLARRYGTAHVGEKRLGEAGGLKEFDDAENARRKARALEEARETAERKAEKKKCAFCKRFSCIC